MSHGEACQDPTIANRVCSGAASVAEGIRAASGEPGYLCDSGWGWWNRWELNTESRHRMLSWVLGLTGAKEAWWGARDLSMVAAWPGLGSQ